MERISDMLHHRQAVAGKYYCEEFVSMCARCKHAVYWHNSVYYYYNMLQYVGYLACISLYSGGGTGGGWG